MRARVIRSCVEDERSNARAHVQVKTLLSEKSLDNPYTGGLSSFGLLLLLTRFLQHVNIMRAHEGGAAVGGAGAGGLGELLAGFLDFLGDYPLRPSTYSIPTLLATPSPSQFECACMLASL